MEVVALMSERQEAEVLLGGHRAQDVVGRRRGLRGGHVTVAEACREAGQLLVAREPGEPAWRWIVRRCTGFSSTRI